MRLIRSARLRLAVILGAVIGLALLGGPASATFPGSNGRIIVHAYDGRDYELYRGFTPTGMKKITEQRAVSSQNPDWKADGSMFVAECKNPQTGGWPDICTFAPNGDIIDKVVDLPSDQLDAYEPSWQPNGRHIVYSGGDGTNMDSDLFVVDSDGDSDPAPLTTSPGWSESAPQWSPKGNWIVFSAQNQSHPNSTFRIRPDGTDREMILERMSLGVSWSPDGKWLLFSRMVDSANKADLFRMRPDGSNIERVTRTPNRDEWMPAYSPNGRSIAFIEDFTKLVRLNLHTGDRDVNLHALGNMGMPAWQPIVP